MRLLLIALLLILGCYSNVIGQVDKEFWFAIPKETSGHGYLNASPNNVSFKITNMSDILTAHVVISMPANGSFTTREFDIAPSSTHIEVVATTWDEFDDIYANPAAYGSVSAPGITTHGINISSNNDITVYYDYNNYYNRDLFSLKGSNALGTDFYLPFQNIWANGGPSYDPDPLSSADIVATEDNTTITIYPTVILKGRTNTTPYTVTLNKGQTYSVVANGYSTAEHFTGTRITSDKPIAITINDDSLPVTGQTCYDIVGDQIIPVNVCGMDYLVMTGSASTTVVSASVQLPSRGEQIIVAGTAAATTVSFYNKAGTLLYSTTIGAGGSTYISPNILDANQTSIYIHATNPIYVLHITGIGCEMGGAVVPPITNCTGSNEVAFYRSSISSGGLSTLTLNLMVPYDSSIPFNSPTQSHYYFTVYYQDGTTFSIPGSWFEPVSQAGWAVLQKAYRGSGGGIADYIPIDAPVRIVNTKDFFHLGITNGYSGQTNKYGYFSSFNATKAAAVVASVNEASYISCFGDTVFLKASGGLGYSWHYGSPSGPTTYLNNPTTSTPQVFCPPGTHNFYVVVNQSKCFGDDTIKVSVTVLPEVKASFITDVTAACAPFKAQFTNESTGATRYAWSYQKDSDAPITFTPTNALNFTQPTSGYFQNNTAPYKPIIYSYKLMASYYGECPDSITKQIVVYPVINANFAPNDTTGCHPALVNFRNLSNGNVADSLYFWNFGDGNSSTTVNPVHTFKNQFLAHDTTFSVSLVATSPYYCRDTANSTVTVHPYIKAAFAVDTVKGCSPMAVKIYNICDNKKAISTYLWDFGDGTTSASNKDTLTHAYPVNTSTSPVTYRLLLTVKHLYDNGCPDTVSRLITVYPQSSVSFITTPGTTSLCDSTVVAFTTTASAAVTSYFWNFGDGSTSSDKNPSHIFNNPTVNNKTYNVVLTGITNEYCNSYDTLKLTVFPYLDPEFAINVPTNCAPFDAEVVNKSRGGITSYSWVYGDGSSDHHSVADTTHRYRNATAVVFSPQIKLVVTNNGGCKDSITQRITVYPEIKADFTPSSLIGCNPLTVNFTNTSTHLTKVAKYFSWNFGDNTSSTDQDPEHVFVNTSNAAVSFPVKLTVTSEYNCKDDTTRDIGVYPYIQAKFTVDTVKGCSPFNVGITDDSRGSITSYNWTYGDGNTDNHTLKNYYHTYYNNSVNNTAYNTLTRYLTLEISNTSGLCKSRDSVLLTIYPEVETSFTTNVTEGCNPLTVNYTNTSGPGAVPVTYDWTFGDGGTSTLKNPDHVFQNLTSIEKTYQTRLIAYSTFKCSDTAKIDFKVYPFIDANFSFDNAEGCSPLTITISNSSSTGSNGFAWDFDDGNTSVLPAKTFTHMYSNTGTSTKTYYPRLIASYNNMCQDTVIRSLQVYPEVKAGFTEDTLKGCHPFVLKFTNTSLNGDYFKWTFGDKGSSVLKDPTHIYYNYSNVDSVYNISMVASSQFNCKDSISKQVTVYPKPKALLDVDNSVSCPPFSLEIRNLSQAGDYYTWNYGDGDTYTTTSMAPVNHLYDNLTANTVTYDLELLVQTIHNCSSSVSQSINVFPRVVADFTPDTAGCNPFFVPFENKTVRGVKYKWDFGDQITSALKSPSHKFFNNSVNDTTFQVRLVGYSELECTDTAYRQVLVHPQPLAEFSALPSYLYYPDARVNIDNQTNTGYWNYQWNFGDGISSTVEEPGTHEYLHWGDFDLQLKAWNQYCSDSVTHTIKVKAPYPIADFDPSDNGCVPLTVQFTNHSTWGTSYKWEFDDGSVSTEANPSHIYQTAGKFQVKLTVSGDGGDDVTYREVEVYPLPKVSFTVSPRYVMLPDALVQTYNATTLGNKYVWDFGDGDTSQMFEPAHTYKELGVFDITLNVWTEHQCFDSVVFKDAVTVEGQGKLVFPNAFAPNKSGPSGGKYTADYVKNDIFHPYHEGVEDYKLEIYDRWGELLFETTDVYTGWDGYYKNKLCNSDVYIWKAKGKFYNGSSFNKAGDVTLLQ